jgi:hypothetical protein
MSQQSISRTVALNVQELENLNLKGCQLSMCQYWQIIARKAQAI